MDEKKAERYLDQVRRVLRLDRLSPPARKAVVVIVGGLLLAAGVVMLITPGPAFILIPLGLLVMGTEFEWPRKAMRAVMKWVKRLRSKRRKTILPMSSSPPPALPP
jgi:hypothetical protein